jgi:hypothetical protein
MEELRRWTLQRELANLEHLQQHQKPKSASKADTRRKSVAGGSGGGGGGGGEGGAGGGAADAGGGLMVLEMSSRCECMHACMYPPPHMTCMYPPLLTLLTGRLALAIGGPSLRACPRKVRGCGQSQRVWSRACICCGCEKWADRGSRRRSIQ